MPVSAVIWSAEARQTYFDIIDFLSNRWTEKEVSYFINRTELSIRFPTTLTFLSVIKTMI
jgi:hypothetical protein